MVHPSWRPAKKIKGKAFELFAETVRNNLGKEVIRVIKIKYNKRVYKVLLKGGGIIRIDFRQSKKITRLQMLVYNGGVKVAKVLKSGRVKLSEWIKGQDLYFVKNLPEVNIQLGELLGKLNTVKENDKYVAVGDINNTNFIWTKNKELYLIDLGDLCLLDYDKAMLKVAGGVSKRVAKNRRKWFYEGYAKYHNIDQFIKIVNEYDKVFGKKYLIEG